MTEAPSTREEEVHSFWCGYINKFHESGIKPPFDRWRVRRAEDYLAANADRRLTVQTSVDDVDAYLTELGSLLSRRRHVLIAQDRLGVD